VRLLISLFKQLTPKGDRGKYFPLIVGHNIGFDISFLDYLFKRVGKNLNEYVSSSNNLIKCFDTLELAMAQNITGKHKLSNLSEKLGFEAPEAHRAMADVIMTKKLLEYYVGLLRTDKKIKTVDLKEKEAGNSEVEQFRKHFEF
jgi:DNA polymerase III alpha subunit (gram-positive type)